jgi:4'-phosphopantetheinyl transferase EntD
MHSDLFRELLPHDVASISADPRNALVEALPEEAELVAQAIPGRRREFACGRWCARNALKRFGIHDFPLRRGPHREPIWPAGIVGSITHTSGVCAAAAASAKRYFGLGLDVEPDKELEQRLVERVSTANERSYAGFLLPELSARLVFSAKEAVYKCQFYLTRRFLDFNDVSIDLEADGVFQTRVHVSLSELQGSIFVGRWERRNGYFLTASWLVNPRQNA